MSIKRAVEYMMFGFFFLSFSMYLVALLDTSWTSWLIYLPTCFVFGAGVWNLWDLWRSKEAV